MCRNGFNVKFALQHTFREDFYGSKVIPVPILAVWRLIVGLYCLAWWIYNLISYPDGTFFIFLTHWANTASTTFFLIGAALSITTWVQQCRSRAQDQNNQPMYERLDDEECQEDTEVTDTLAWYHKAFWVIYNIAANVSCAITVFYYAFFYFHERKGTPKDGYVNDFTKHLFVTVFLLLETGISGIPVLISHVIYPFVFTGSYLAFTVIFWLLEGVNHKGKKQIYEAVEYGTTPAAYVALGAFLFACVQLVLHVIFFAICKLRHRFCKKERLN